MIFSVLPWFITELPVFLNRLVQIKVKIDHLWPALGHASRVFHFGKVKVYVTVTFFGLWGAVCSEIERKRLNKLDYR